MGLHLLLWLIGKLIQTFASNIICCRRDAIIIIKLLIILFHSSDGRSRAGVYCAANACIEQVIQHGEVDVFQAVKTVRRHRPQLVDNMVNGGAHTTGCKLCIFDNYFPFLT